MSSSFDSFTPNTNTFPCSHESGTAFPLQTLIPITNQDSPIAEPDVVRFRPLDTESAKIMLIDDEPINMRLVEKYLRNAGYKRVSTCHDSESAFDLIRQQRPDVVICDIHMPVSGLKILTQVMQTPELEDTQMIMVTASDDETLRFQALETGATELLEKPIRSSHLLPRVKNALLVRSHLLHSKSENHCLEQLVQQRTLELETSRLELIHCLARLADYRDNETGRHVVRVGQFSGLIAEQLGLDPATRRLIEQAAPLHDIGKIGIPDSILLKEGKLTPEEFETMQKHVLLGKKAFEPMNRNEWEIHRRHTLMGKEMISVGNSPLLKMAAEIALTHHERWDGTGYPLGLAGEEIPLSGRIVAVADVFDALTSKRPYKPAFSNEKSFNIIEEASGQHFDPAVVNAFKAAREQIIQVRMDFADVM